MPVVCSVWTVFAICLSVTVRVCLLMIRTLYWASMWMVRFILIWLTKKYSRWFTKLKFKVLSFKDKYSKIPSCPWIYQMEYKTRQGCISNSFTVTMYWWCKNASCCVRSAEVILLSKKSAGIRRASLKYCFPRFKAPMFNVLCHMSKAERTLGEF